MEDRCCFGIKANFILDTLDFTQTFKDIFLFGVLGGLLDVPNQAYMLAGFEPVNKLLNEDVFFLCTRKPGHLLLGFATSGSVFAILGIPRKNFNIKDQRKEPTILEPREYW